MIDGKSVTAIDYRAFYNQTGITAVTLPDSIKSIGSSAFSNCVSLTDINIPYGVTSIGSSAFSNCVSLKDINIPDSVTSIDSSAFIYCASLDSINIPQSVTNIGSAAFSACMNLRNINVDKYNSNYSSLYGVLYDKNKTKLLCCPSKLNYVVGMPDSLKRIGDCAFYGCIELKEIDIPANVTYIGFSAFEQCKKLTSVRLPNSLTTISKYAFLSCEALTDIVIPDSVTLINYYAFENCKSLRSVSLPSKLKNLYDGVFSGCSSLTYIDIPDTVWHIGEAFTGCTSLSGVKLPGWLTSLYGTFKGCTSLTSITLPGNLTAVGGHTFEGCTGLASITIPVSVTSIGDDAFSGCSNLKSITIPSSVTSIGWGAFDGCSSLTSITIPDSVTSIGRGAFGGCSSLTSITIPDSVISIGLDAFKNCSSLTIYGKAGSYAETYAKDNGFKFVSTSADTELKNSSAISATTVTVGTEVTMTGKATGGTAPYKFAYYYKKSTDSSWTKLVTENGSAYVTASTQQFKPTTAGTYNIKINVKDNNGTGTVVSKDFDLTVKGTAFKNNSTVSATTVKAGTEVTMTGKATGGISPYKYAYYYKKSTDSAWTKAYVTSSGSAYTKYDSVTFKPTTAGTYNVKINVKDNNGTGTMVSKEFTVNVTADTALKNNSAVSATTVTAGTEVTLNGKAEGGTSPYKYAYYYKKSTDSAWTKAYVTSSGSAYTKYDSKSFTPKAAGTYYVRINVKDNNGTGTAVTKDFTIKVK